jgi:predicted metal-dependent hydrolase
VHELCHLPHKNHSPEFWQAVADILPDYALRRSWLRENGINLDLP